MALDQKKYEHSHETILRDIRPMRVRLADSMRKPTNAMAIFFILMMSIHFSELAMLGADFILLFSCLFFWWLTRQDRSLAFKMPKGAKWKDNNNTGAGRDGTAEGILYLGNADKTNEEVWFTNSDTRTHVLYLGTTGSGKTEGLKSMVTNALTWGSGFVYIDGKADTDLWSSLSSLVKRFGRDDDLLVLNYMTGNSDSRAPSNTMNPFSSGSASYLTNMLVSLMPEAEGDNAMWKERAVSLIGSLMPALTWKRDYQEIPMSIGTIRDALVLKNVIKLSRDEALPESIRMGIMGYLDTLPGYIDAAFDDEGREKPPGPDTPQYDTTTPNQQHGYLSMQFTRALQSLGDDYGYIFDTQAADVDMTDVVLNRRILVVLIPALEKSGDEIANLGKIVSATIKGMMGSTLGATVEGESSAVIENKPTHSATPFMVVFDEVGYYTAQGMAVMAAQARSLGFCLVYSAQDLPAMEKRVKEEARSIVANCNIKIFGKLEDPTQTKEFFEKTVGSAIVTEVSSYQLSGGSSTGSYIDTQQAGVQVRARASYDGLRSFHEGQAVVAFGEGVVDVNIFYSNPGFAKAMRVTRYVSLPPPDDNIIKHAKVITKTRDLLVHKTWTALKADVALETPIEIKALAKGYKMAEKASRTGIECGMNAIVGVYALDNEIPEKSQGDEGAAKPKAAKAETAAPAAPATPAAPTQAPQAAATPAPETAAPATKENDDSTADGSTDESAGGDGGGNPMSFFSNKNIESPETENEDEGTDESEGSTEGSEAPAASSAPVEPISWDDLVEESDATDTPAEEITTAAPAPPTSEAPQIIQQEPKVETEQNKIEAVNLDPGIEDILKKAGKEARDAIAGKKNSDKADDTETTS
jgi:intracellular multiplication protein IcmO